MQDLNDVGYRIATYNRTYVTDGPFTSSPMIRDPARDNQTVNVVNKRLTDDQQLEAIRVLPLNKAALRMVNKKAKTPFQLSSGERARYIALSLNSQQAVDSAYERLIADVNAAKLQLEKFKAMISVLAAPEPVPVPQAAIAQDEANAT